MCASSGDLSPEAGQAVVAHLKGCAKCQTELVSVLRTLRVVAGGMEDQESPAVRQAASLRFAAALHASKQARIVDPQPGRHITPWLPLAAATLVLVLGGVLTHSALAVKADEVLRTAVQAEEFRTLPSSRWVRLDVRPDPAHDSQPVAFMSIDREAGGQAAGLSDPLVQRGLPDAARRLLTTFSMDWRQPMSASPFQRWRAGLRDRRDTVTRRSDRIVVQTWTSDGPVREAALVLHRESYRVTRQRWVFDRVGVVEMKEVEPPMLQAGLRPPPVRIAASTPDVLDDVEIDARLALGAVGADVAGARVSQVGSVVRVEGGFASRGQAQAVERALRGMRHVELRPPTTRTSGNQPVVAGEGLAQRLQSLIADAEQRRRFAPELTGLTVRVRQRAEVLNGLGDRYSKQFTALTPGARTKLKKLLNLHFAALNKDLVTLESRLAILAGGSTGRRSTPLAAAPLDWARRARDGHEQAQRLERSVTALIADDGLEARDVAAGPLGQLAAIWATFNSVRRP